MQVCELDHGHTTPKKPAFLLGAYWAILSGYCTKLADTVMAFYIPSLITVANQKLITVLLFHTDENLQHNP
jgi:hypothetical protein